MSARTTARTLITGFTASLALAAVPFAQQAQFTVDTTNDTVDAAPGDGVCADAAGNCSLRAAVMEANASLVATRIDLADGVAYSLTLAGAGEDAAATGDLDVTGRIELRGFDASLDAAGLDRAFDVLPGGALSVDRLSVTGGAVTDASGGLFRSAGDLALTQSTLTGGSATGAGASGGGLFNDGGNLFLDLCSVSGGAATRAGGAIEANGGVTRVDRSLLAGNSTGPMPGNGGALHLTGAGVVDVSRSEVSGNTASAEGGGLWNSLDGTMTVDRTDVLDNAALGTAADNGGGGLFNDGGHLAVLRSTVAGNTATEGSGSGGGLLNDGGTLTLFRTLVAENSAARAGGGVEADAGSTVLTRVKLLGNAAGPAPGNGGGLHLTGPGTVLVSDGRVCLNTASAEGGGLWNSGAGTMTVRDTRVEDNTAGGADADQGGGGLFNDGGTLLVEGSMIRDNLADGAAGSGGGLLNNLGDVTVSDSTFTGNVSSRAGGGIEANAGNTTLRDVALTANSTGASPGNGGGLHITGLGLATLFGGSVTGNDASAEGGGLWNSAVGTLAVTGTTVQGNSAPVGPDVFNDGGSFVLDGADVPVGP